MAESLTYVAVPLPDVADMIAKLFADPEVQAALLSFVPQESRYRQWQIDLTHIPAPPFGEVARGQWLAQRFAEIGLTGIHRDEVGNILAITPAAGSRAPREKTSNVTALHLEMATPEIATPEKTTEESGAPKPYVAVIAHVDTVFPLYTQTDVREEGAKLFGPGISDNSAGVIAMLAVAEAILACGVQLVRPILFVGSVGEEGEGNLRGVRRIFADDSAWRRRVAHVIAVDGAGTDSIVTEALGSRRFEVTLCGPGGHSWNDFGAPNPILALARALDRFSQVILPQSPGGPKSAINVGTISGGTSVNSIPESATARVDMRSAGTAELDRLERALELSVEFGMQSENGRLASSGLRRYAALTAEMRKIGDRPAGDLPPEARILEVIRAVDAQLGILASLHRASTDANIPLSLGMEAIAIGGGGTGGGAHTLHEWFDCRDREVGLQRLLLAALALAGVA